MLVIAGFFSCELGSRTAPCTRVHRDRPSRNSPPAILLREGYREDGKVRKRTLANLSHWDPQLIEHFRLLLKGGVAVELAASVLSIERALPHGHVAAVLGAARGSGCAAWFGSAPQELQPLLQAMLVARVLEPASKLATHRSLHDDTATLRWAACWAWGKPRSVDDLYRALDWLQEAQPAIERRLARAHLLGSTLVLYDLTSTWLTGRCCELAVRGHSRDGKRDDPQIVFGLVCSAEGCPVAVEVFAGNTGDPATVAQQVAKLKQRFGIERIAWVGDRGMLTSARIEQVLRPQGMDWVEFAARAADRAAGRRARAVPAVAVRPAQSDRAEQRALPRRAAGGVPQPSSGRGARAQAPGAAGGHRGRSGEDRRGHAAHSPAAARRAGDRAARGARDRALSHGQAPGACDHAQQLQLATQGRIHRRRGRARRAVRDPHQLQPGLPSSSSRSFQSGQQPGRHVERAFRSMKTIDLHVRPCVPLQRAARARACVPVHAGLLRRVADAPAFEADAVR